MSTAGFSFAMASSEDQTSAEAKAVQSKALDEILGVLLSAGYFRARIGALTAFDKVVGGLCWCITSSGTAVDVDIFYDEDLALGQKIQLSENIVIVLRTMGCPAPLQAHQITGGDYVAIFPVMRWLVTKVLEYRRIIGDYVRMASETTFDMQYVPFTSSGSRVTSNPSILSAVLKTLVTSYNDSTSSTSAPSSSSYPTAAVTSSSTIQKVTNALKSDNEKAGDIYLNEVNNRYKPLRKYRRAIGKSTNLSAEARIQSCLLEFGERTVVKASTATEDEENTANTAAAKAKDRNTSGNEFERKFAAMQKTARAEEEEKRKAAVALEASILSQMTEAKAGAVSGQNVGALVGLQAEELRKAAEEYRQKEEELKALAESGDLLANTKHGRAAAHGRRVAALVKRKETAEESRNEQATALQTVENELVSLREAVTKAEKYNNRAITEIAKLDAQVNALPPAQQAQYRSLVELHSRVLGLKEQEAQFKAGCATTLAQLQKTLEDMKQDNTNGLIATRLGELEGLHTEARSRFDRARAVMAARAREIAKLSRILDEVPQRLELVQYERRFLELFDEVSERLDETRKYYTLYNTLEKKRGFLAKEDALLTNIIDNFGNSMKTTKGQKVYLEQVEATVKSMEEAVTKQMSLADQKRNTRDQRAQDLQVLVDAQRAYYRAVRDMQEAAELNEQLQSKVNG